MKVEDEIDVLIVGYGAAGANAAIAAHDAGARVLIFEKLAAGGGNSAVCAGAMVVPKTLEDALAYYRALSCGTAGEAMIRSFAEAMVAIPDLLSRLGIDYVIERDVPPTFSSLMAGSLRQIHIHPTGEGGMQFLDRLVRERNVRVWVNTQVSALIQHPETGEVLGVKAWRDGQEIQVFARQAVILTCGGYGSNPAMLANFNLPGATEYIFPYGSPGNTGDGIALVSKAGGALWHMAAIEWGRLCARVPSRLFGTAIGYGLGRVRNKGAFIFVNKQGQRFMAEDTSLSHCKSPLDILHYNHARAEYQNLPAFLIFDEQYLSGRAIAPAMHEILKKRGGRVGYNLINGFHDWSDDNRAEIEAGWILRAPTIVELAGKIGVPAASLTQTIEQYNQVCFSRDDSKFGRKKNNLVAFGEAPFYAIELGLAIVNTQGGPKRNGKSQVLDHDDRVIPRLYAAGELGSFFGFLYQPGSNYPEAWAFGQIAGAAAAAEPPRLAPSREV